MKIFVTGATGTIGSGVAQALRRAGHEVWGLTRSEAKARALVAGEIRPVRGTLQEPERWRAAAEACSVLVHCAVDYETDTLGLDLATVDALTDLSASGPRPKTLVYTSGAWVYGDTDGLADETSTLKPPKHVARRPEIERQVLEAPGVRGLVVRPGTVYGRQGGLTGLWFRGALDGSLQVIGDGLNRWAMIHVDDLADGYVRAIESGLHGEVFALTDRSRHTVAGMARAAGRAAGYTGEIQYVPVEDAVKTMGELARCLALDQHIDSRKAVNLLGWQPRHGGFVDEVDTYFACWKEDQAQAR